MISAIYMLIALPWMVYCWESVEKGSDKETLDDAQRRIADIVGEGRANVIIIGSKIFATVLVGLLWPIAIPMRIYAKLKTGK